MQNIEIAQIAAQLAQSAVQIVRKDISRGTVEVPEQSSGQFSRISKSRLSKQDERLEENLSAVIRKRKQLQQQLQRVKYDEEAIKQKMPHPMSESQQGKTKYFRSSISQDQKERINKILKQTKKFQRSVAKKTIQLEQKIKKSIQQQKLLRQIAEKERLEQRQKQVLQNLNALQLRKQQRTKQIAQANKLFQKVAKRKSLHNELQEKWKVIEKIEQEENQKLFEKNRQQQRYKVEQMKQHARRYSQIVKNYREKRQIENQKLKEKLLERSRLEKYNYSTFFNTATLQQNQRRNLQAARLQQYQFLQTKRQQYAKEINQKNKISFNPQKCSPLPKEKKNDIRTSMSLDNLGLNKLGNEYMKKVNTKIGQQNTGKKMKSPKIEKRSEQIVKYQDYLTQARLSRKSSTMHEVQSQQIRELKNIMKNREEDRLTKLKRAKLFVSKLDEKADHTDNTDSIINSIVAKLSIIDEFAQPL